MSEIAIPVRLGIPQDARTLAAIERDSFAADRMSARSIRELLRKPSAQFLVAAAPNDRSKLLGYALILFRNSTSVARLYSIAVAPEARGRGIAEALLAAVEDEARRHGDLFMRLEVRADNAAAIALYRKSGYREFGRHLDYYEDHGAALRMEKSLIAKPPHAPRHLPYYFQTTSFTCGPCALMMAMAGLGAGEPLSREYEFQLWREATSIYLISAPGGCDPIGMAVVAARRGFLVEVRVNRPGPYFTQARKGKQRLDVMREAQRILARQAEELGVPVRLDPLDLQGLIGALDRGAVVINLISTNRMYGDHTPHWIVAYDYDSDYIFARDPWVGRDDHETPAQKAGIAIAAADFADMAVWGRSRLRAAIIVERKPAS